MRIFAVMGLTAYFFLYILLILPIYNFFFTSIAPLDVNGNVISQNANVTILINNIFYRINKREIMQIQFDIKTNSARFNEIFKLGKISVKFISKNKCSNNSMHALHMMNFKYFTQPNVTESLKKNYERQLAKLKHKVPITYSWYIDNGVDTYTKEEYEKFETIFKQILQTDNIKFVYVDEDTPEDDPTIPLSY